MREIFVEYVKGPIAAHSALIKICLHLTLQEFKYFVRILKDVSLLLAYLTL